MRTIARRSRILLIALPSALLLAFVLLAFFHAQHTFTRARQTAATAGQLPFTLHSYDSQTGAPAFELLASTPSFTAAATLDGRLYVAGPAGLRIYQSDGTLLQDLRTGRELPVAPITALATGRLRGAPGPQILLATAGAGVLLLSPASTGPTTLQQLLPATPGTADLTALQPLPTGDLLLGTRRHGVLLFSGDDLRQLPIPFPAVDSATLQVTALADPDATSILIATRDSGVFYAHAGTVQHFDTTTGLPDNQVQSLAATPTQAYLGTPLGVAQLDLPTAHIVRILAPGVFANALALDPTQLTIGTLDQGILRLPLGPARARLRNASITLDPPTTSSQRIDALLPTPAGLLILADGRILYNTTTARSEPPTPATLLTDRNISALAFDPRGRLFIGFFDHGLDILDGATVSHLEDDRLFCINRLALDPRRHTLAAATANGLVLFDTEGVPRQTLTRRDGLLSDHVTDIAFTRAGTVLATPAGLTFLTPTGTESVFAFQGLVNNHVYTLASDPATDRVLAGTLGGLSVLASTHIQRNFTATNSALGHNWITALAPAPSGDTLIGTYGAGLQRLSPQGAFTPVELPANAPHDLVINPNALLVTPSHIFAGTLGHGLLACAVATGRCALITAGLPSLNVTAFALHDNQLYIGTENGLVRIPEAAL